MICLFILIEYMNRNNYKYNSDMINNVKENTDIDKIEYVNYYNEYYVVLDNDYLYLINKDYKIISKIDKKKIYENDKKYDIIYNDEKLIYINERYVDGVLVYEYYDLYTYKHIKTIKIGEEDG